MTEWSFLTNHARVLVCIAHDPGDRLRDIATTLDITERSAYSIVTDLTTAGYVVKAKDGRRNRYEIQATCRYEKPSPSNAPSARCSTCSSNPTPASDDKRMGDPTSGRIARPGAAASPTATHPTHHRRSG